MRQDARRNGGLTFAGLGCGAPRGALAVAVPMACAASVAGAMYLIMGMDGSFA